jgi:hypothetical protein
VLLGFLEFAEAERDDAKIVACTASVGAKRADSFR